MDKFKKIWNNPRYNALIRLGLWFIFFTLVILYIRLSPKQEIKPEIEEKTITYSDIKKDFASDSVMLTMQSGNYYINGVIKDNTFSGTIQNDDTTSKIYYDGTLYTVSKGTKTETTSFNDLNTNLLLPKNIINIIDNYNGLLKVNEDEKTYSYDINGEKYTIYIKDEKICKVIYEKDNIISTLEYNYL